MPVISMFYGVIVSLYFVDNSRHRAPHIHVKYQESEVVLGLPDGDILDGSIPANKLKLVQAWIENGGSDEEGVGVTRIDDRRAYRMRAE